MATKAAVVTGTLPHTVSNTVNLTSSGFGTVDAAIIYISNANTTNNPQNNQYINVGFWDGNNSTQRASSSGAIDNAGATQAARANNTSNVVFLCDLDDPSGNPTYIAASCSNTTDGITLTVSASNTGADRYVTAILINGALNTYGGTVNLGTGTSAIDVTSPGFKPDLLFLATTGQGSAAASSPALVTFGVAHNDSTDTVSQGCIGYYSNDAVSTSDSVQWASSSFAAAQITSGGTSWSASVSAFDSSGFSITPSANASSDIVDYLAIELADPDDAWVDLITAATSTGNDATTGVGFAPDVVSLLGVYSTTDGSGVAGYGISYGAGDASSDVCYFCYDEDNVATTNSSSEYDSANIYHITDDGGTDDAIASLSSLDSDGFTLNYSDAASSAWRILAFAIGDSTAGGDDVAITVPSGDLSFSTFAPTLTLTDDVNVSVPSADLSFSTFAPTLTLTNDVSISVPSADLSFSTFAPTIATGDDVNISVPTADLSFSTFAPTLTLTGDIEVTVPSGDLTLSTVAPTLAVTDDKAISVPSGNLAFSTFAPTLTLTVGTSISVPSGALSLSTFAPTLALTGSISITAPSGNLLFSSTAPDVTGGSVPSTNWTKISDVSTSWTAISDATTTWTTT